VLEKEENGPEKVPGGKPGKRDVPKGEKRLGVEGLRSFLKNGKAEKKPLKHLEMRR